LENDEVAACSISINPERSFAMTPLRRRTLEDMAIRNLADNTCQSYVQQIVSYSNYFHRPPEELGPEEIRTYQLYLTQTRRLSPSSVSVATGALRFLYKVTHYCPVKS
jgi:integrase/recombinase XerD